VGVGAIDGNTHQGAAYVFTESGSEWTQTAELTASDLAMGDRFGNAVAINESGNTVVVGALAGSDAAQDAAYVFTEPASGWKNMTQTAKLTAADGNAGWGFGGSVSISGNTVVVAGGAFQPGGTPVMCPAYVFTEPASGWTNMTPSAKLTAPDGAGFGAVSISGNTVVAGTVAAPLWSGPGAAYVFTESGSVWTQAAELTDFAPGADDEFGTSVSISGNTVVVGAPWFEVHVDFYTVAQGAAFVFTEPASGWRNATLTAELTASDGAEGDEFGTSVSISGNTVVVGAICFFPDVNMYGPGASYVFTESGSSWTQTAELTASGGAAGDEFGSSVSIGGNTMVVGAPYATVGGNSQQGAAYVYGTPPPPLTVTPVDWTSAGLTLTLGSDGNLHVYTTGTTTDAVPPVAPASVSNIEITAPSGTTANLTIDSTNGDPIPAGGLNYSGAGGLIITGSGIVTLSGTNTYTGGTTVSSGTLLINAASALPDGTNLTIGAGGSFVFDPSQSASSATTAGAVASARGTAAASETCAPIVAASTLAKGPVAASILSTVSPRLERQVKNLSHVPAAPSSVASDAVFASHRSTFDRIVAPVDNAQSARPWAWLAAIESAWNSSDQNQKTDSNVAALDKVLARFGV